MAKSKVQITFEFDQASNRFRTLLNEVMARSSRDWKDELRIQFAGLVRNIIAITPPMGGSKASLMKQKSGAYTVDYASAYQKGAKAIENDVKKALHPIDGYPATPQKVLSWYLGERGANRRIPKGIYKFAAQSDIDFVKKDLLKRRGETAAGWMAAVERYRVSGVPAWIKRGHKNSGTCAPMDFSPTLFVFEANNNTTHSDSPRIQRQVTKALNMQAGFMARSLWGISEGVWKSAIKKYG